MMILAFAGRRLRYHATAIHCGSPLQAMIATFKVVFHLGKRENIVNSDDVKRSLEREGRELAPQNDVAPKSSSSSSSREKRCRKENYNKPKKSSCPLCSTTGCSKDLSCTGQCFHLNIQVHCVVIRTLCGKVAVLSNLLFC